MYNKVMIIKCMICEIRTMRLCMRIKFKNSVMLKLSTIMYKYCRWASKRADDFGEYDARNKALMLCEDWNEFIDECDKSIKFADNLHDFEKRHFRKDLRELFA